MKYRYYVILDFEATCQKVGKPRPQEIIEFPSVIVDAKSNEVISEIQIYVKPDVNLTLTDFCTELTGITQKDVDGGVKFTKALKQYQTWLFENGLTSSNFMFVTCGDWDLKTQFPNQCRGNRIKSLNYFKRWLNVKPCVRSFYKIQRPGSMIAMLKALNIEHVGRHHSGIDDCKNIANIWIKMLKDGYNYSSFEPLIRSLV